MTDSLKKYSLLRTIYMSLYSRNIYRYVCFKWQGLGLAYLSLLIAVCLVPYTIRMSNYVESLYSEDGQESSLPTKLEAIISQVPDMQLKDGKLSMEVSSPVFVKDLDSEQNIIVIDTSIDIASPNINKDTITALNKAMRKYQTYTMLSSYYLLIHEGDRPIERYRLSDIAEFFDIQKNEAIHINRDVVLEWVNKAAEKSSAFPITFFTWNFIKSFILYTLRAVVFAFVGAIICQFFRIELPFTALLRLSIVSSTILILFKSLGMALGTPIFKHEALVYFTMHTVYMYYAIESIKLIKSKIKLH